MFPSYSSLISQKRKFAYYVPWLSLLSLIVVVAGTITSGVGLSSAIKNVNGLLRSMRIDLDAEMTLAQKVAAFVLAGCCVLASGMLAMSCGRSCTEYAVDRRGAPTRGSAYWLGANAFVTVLWWLILVLLMFVFFSCCLSLGLIAAVTQVMEVTTRSADKFINVGMKYHNMTREILEAQLGPLPPGIEPAKCPPTCLRVELLEYFLEREVCICSAAMLQAAYRHARNAQGAMISVVVGSFLVWVGASFLLMNATADFAQARRERALLLRVQRTLAAGGGFGAVAGGGAGLDGLAKAADSSSDPLGELQQPGQQVQGAGAAPTHAGIELAVAAVATYGGGAGYADLDKVPLLKDPQQAPYQESYSQQPYQQQPHQQQPYQQQSYQQQPYQQQPHQQQPYQQQSYQQQPYQQQAGAEQLYAYQEQPVAVATERSDAPAEAGRQSFRKGQ